MIIKVRNLKTRDDLFIDDVYEVTVKNVEDYGLVYEGKDALGCPIIKPRKITKVCDQNGSNEDVLIDKSTAYFFSKMLFDPKIITDKIFCGDSCAEDKKKAKNKFWKFKELECIQKSEDGTRYLEKYIWLKGEQEVFLLNNQGKTIDRYS